MSFQKSIILCIVFFFVQNHLKGQNYDSSFFPIGVWSVKGDFRTIDDHLVYPDRAAISHREHFQDLHNRGFNTFFLSLDPIVYTMDTILDIAIENDMKIIAGMNNLNALIGNSNNTQPSGDDIRTAIINDSIFMLKNSQATLGYYLYDEPLPGWIDFDILAKAKDTLESLTNGNRPILSTWNDVRYMSYIDDYTNLDVLMADAYPFSDSTAIGSLADYMPAYFSAYGDENNPSTIGPATPSYSDYIEMIRKQHCNEKNRPFWMVVQTFGDAVQYEPDVPESSWAFWRQVKPKEIRLQVWTALMQGAKGIFYFLYESEYPALLGMLDISGEPTIRLEEATSVNAQINKISSILLRLNVVEDANVSTDKGEIRLHEDSSINVDNRYVIVANTDYYSNQNIQVKIDKTELDYTVNSIIDKVKDTDIPFEETDTQITFTANLDRADGSLYQLSSALPTSVHDFPNSSAVGIYPNPVSDIFFIKGKSTIESITIIDLNGTILRQETMMPNGNIVSVSDLPNGVYLIRVNTAQKADWYKIVVER